MSGMHLLVNEIFGPTIQGEGLSVGMPCMFLRLVMCNLSCSWCDTPYTWNWAGTSFKHPDKYQREDEVHKMQVNEILDKLEAGNVKALVISGGEPMLQQRRLIPIVSELHYKGWWIEIETNGTLAPDPKFICFIDQVNCSPKLENSGDSRVRRIKEKALCELSACGKTIFKFVVGSKSDMDEINDLVKTFGMKNVWLMPQARTKEELDKNYSAVCEWGKEFNYNVSSRRHIELWGSKRAV